MNGLRLEIIATINTHKIGRRFLGELVEHGVTIMRLNGAHVLQDQIPKAVALIRECCGRDARVLLDLPGNKIRTSGLLESVSVKNGERFELEAKNFNVESFVRHLKEGDVVVSSDGQLKMVVETLVSDRVSFVSLCDGELLNNKGIHLERGRLADTPFLFERDRALLAAGVAVGIDYVGFSFVRTAENAREACRLLEGTGVAPILKIETREATEPDALDAILATTDRFLIDRGDLASEVGVLQFPSVFNRTLEKAVAGGRQVFVATQLFASMCDHNLPYLSEVIEFHRLAHSGIVGIQLSEEIAVGKHPVEVLRLIAALTEEAPA
jgi:pyruvate kinase